MPGSPVSRERIDRFLMDEIDSVPQLEALLLIWRRRPKHWYHSEIARSLYISQELAQDVMRHLVQHHLLTRIETSGDCYELRIDSEEKAQLLESLDTVYRHELVRVSTLIHAKGSRAARDFASAFRFKKEQEP